MKKPVRMSLAKQVLDEMEKCLRDGSWKVGDQIPPEPELMSTFGVSRNTIREAVQSLIHAGILVARPGDGTYVLANDRLEVALNSRLKEIELSKILEARLALEKEIVQLAAKNRTDQDLEILKELLEIRNQPGNMSAEADLRFHTAIAMATDNPILIEVYESISKYLQIVMSAWMAQNSNNSDEINAHNTLYSAIVKQDAKSAEAAICRIVAFDEAVIIAQ